MTKLLLKLFVPNHTKGADSTVRSAVGRLSGVVGVLCNSLLFALKLLVGILSGSVSITADAMNNLSDASSSLVTLVGFKLASRPADEDHPYGHARYEYLSGLAVAVLVVSIGVELARNSVEKIFSPSPVSFSPVLAGVLVLSIGVKLWLFLFNRRLGRHIDSAALTATAADSRNDCITTGAVLLASVLEGLFGWQIDGYMGLGVALFILYSGWGLVKQTVSPLLGEAASPELTGLVTQLMAEEERVLGYHDLMIHDYGPGQRFASLHVEMDHREDPLLCHEIIDNLERSCLHRHGIHLVIHYDPVVTGDAELENMRAKVEALLKQQDPRIGIHDFRMVRGTGHTNLIFDIVLPADLLQSRKQIKKQLDADLAAREEGTFYTVVNYDLASFN